MRLFLWAPPTKNGDNKDNSVEPLAILNFNDDAANNVVEPILDLNNDAADNLVEPILNLKNNAAKPTAHSDNNYSLAEVLLCASDNSAVDKLAQQIYNAAMKFPETKNAVVI